MAYKNLHLFFWTRIYTSWGSFSDVRKILYLIKFYLIETEMISEILDDDDWIINEKSGWITTRFFGIAANYWIDNPSISYPTVSKPQYISLWFLPDWGFPWFHHKWVGRKGLPGSRVGENNRWNLLFSLFYEAKRFRYSVDNSLGVLSLCSSATIRRCPTMEFRLLMEIFGGISSNRMDDKRYILCRISSGRVVKQKL